MPDVDWFFKKLVSFCAVLELFLNFLVFVVVISEYFLSVGYGEDKFGIQFSCIVWHLKNVHRNMNVERYKKEDNMNIVTILY